MYIVEYQYKLKPHAKIEDQIRILTELAAPVYRRIPGCISANIFGYEDTEDKGNQWDYAFVVVWENEVAAKKSIEDNYIGPDSELGKTGSPGRFLEMVEDGVVSYATLLASTE